MTIYRAGRPAATNAKTGLEHLLPGQSAFVWATGITPEKPASQKTADDRRRDFARDHYHAVRKGMTVAQYRASKVLVQNAHSDIARSTVGAGDCADRIRRGGIC